LNTLMIVVSVAILTVLGLLLSYPALEEIITIHHTQALPIGALLDEMLVQVEGKAVSAELASPFAQTRCAIWKAEVLEYHGGKGSHWFPLWSAQSTATFTLGDGTATIGVNPKGADLILHQDLEKEGIANSKYLGPEIFDALTQLKIETKGFFGGEKRLKVKEAILAFGEPVYVLGWIDRSEGKKMISLGKGNCIIVSDHSRQNVIAALYGRVVKRLFWTMVIGGGVLFFILSMMSPSTN
jgi:hypothetical protein